MAERDGKSKTIVVRPECRNVVSTGMQLVAAPPGTSLPMRGSGTYACWGIIGAIDLTRRDFVPSNGKTFFRPPSAISIRCTHILYQVPGIY